MDPLTASLIIGGLRFAGDAFGGPSDEVKLARDQLRQRRREYEGREDRRDDALRMGSARERAQRALRNQLLQHTGGLQTRGINAASLFADPTNPFSSSSGGRLGPGVSARPIRSGPDPLAGISFSPEALGTGDFALPSPEMRGRTAVRRGVSSSRPEVAALMKRAAEMGKLSKQPGIRGRTYGKVQDQIQGRIDDILRERGMI